MVLDAAIGLMSDVVIRGDYVTNKQMIGMLSGKCLWKILRTGL